MTAPAKVPTLTIRTVELRKARDLAGAAERLTEIAAGEGFVVAGAYPLSRVASEAARGDLPAAVGIELDAPLLSAALLKAHPELAVLLPWRLHLVEREGRITMSSLDPSALRELVPVPSSELHNRIAWLEVAHEIVMEVLA